MPQFSLIQATVVFQGIMNGTDFFKPDTWFNCGLEADLKEEFPLWFQGHANGKIIEVSDSSYTVHHQESFVAMNIKQESCRTREL